MNRWETIIQGLETEAVSQKLSALYGRDPGTVRQQQDRYAKLIRMHQKLFGDREKIELISAPGRTEIGGNHTDHNHGRVLAAAVNLDALCAVSPREDSLVRFNS